MLPKILYHYCSVESFFKIINSKTIRLNSLYLMSDYLENQWIYNHISDVNNHFHIDDSNLFIKGIWRYLNEVLFIPFIACFSSSGDVLSQWRAYSDNASGISIGFNTEYFEINEQPPDLTKINIIHMSWGQVIYEEKKQKEKVIEIFQQYSDEIKADDYDLVMQKSTECGAKLVSISPVIKNPNFSEEQEWRIIHPVRVGTVDNRIYAFDAANNIEYFHSNNRIVPYIPLDLSEKKDIIKPINEIYLGPKNPDIKNKASIIGFLQEKGFENVEIKVSEVPYR